MDGREQVRRIESALAIGQADLALSLIDQLGQRWQGEGIVLRWRARALLSQDRAEEALEQSRLALVREPQSVAAHVLHAQAAWQLGRLTPAQNAFERALQLSRNDPAIRCEYALFMAGNRAPSVAEPIVQEALKASPVAAEAWSALGLLRLRENRLPEATAAMERAFELDPRNRRGMAWMAMLLQRSGHAAEAAALGRLLSSDAEGPVSAEQRERRVIRAVFEREPAPVAMFEQPLKSAARRGRGWVAAFIALALVAALLAWLAMG